MRKKKAPAPVKVCKPVVVHECLVCGQAFLDYKSRYDLPCPSCRAYDFRRRKIA